VTGGRYIEAKAKVKERPRPELLEAKAKATILGPRAVLEHPIPGFNIPTYTVGLYQKRTLTINMA